MSRRAHGPNDYEPDEPGKATFTCVADGCGEEFWYMPEDVGDIGLEVEVYEGTTEVVGWWIICNSCLKHLEPELETAGIKVVDGEIVRLTDD